LVDRHLLKRTAMAAIACAAACSRESPPPLTSLEPTSLAGKDVTAVEGVWSGLFTSRDHPAWKIEDQLCWRCPLPQYRYLQSQLADPANDQRSLREIDEEAQRVGNEHRQSLMTDAQRQRLDTYTPPADASTQCESPHLWQLVLAPLPLSIDLRDGFVVLHQHHWNVVRTIALGEPLDAQSVQLEAASAQFEGGTLVVETRDVPELTVAGVSFADGARIIERYTPDASGQRLEIEIMVVDPTSFREPLILRDARVRTPEVQLFDYDPCGNPFAP
jgi:hypothetical protein